MSFTADSSAMRVGDSVDTDSMTRKPTVRGDTDWAAREAAARRQGMRLCSNLVSTCDITSEVAHEALTVLTWQV